MKAKKFLIRYIANGVLKEAHSSCDDFTLIEGENNGYTLTLDAKTPLQIERILATFDVIYPNGSSFFVNGFQSWSVTKEMYADEKQTNVPRISHKAMFKGGNVFYGDFLIHGHTIPYTRKAGCFHSFSYTYINNNNRSFNFFGSLNERTGYTVFGSNFNKSELLVSKELEGVTLTGKTVIFDIAHIVGGKDDVIDKYLQLLRVPKLTAPEIRGYSSWYNYYQNISEDVIMRDLNGFDVYSGKLNLFQVDDGYQQYVGDYLKINKTKFPSGMKPVADAIHAKGLLAGIWLAPFIAEEKSDLFKEHPDWFRSANGAPIKIGSNWSGYYALDLEKPEVKAHLAHTFDVIHNEWGFDLVKLDFLVAAGNMPWNGKSRATLMFEGMEMLREWVGDMYILGCGCPMLPAFGKVEYMRIGSDMRLSWKDSIFKAFTIPENPSTVHAIYNATYRNHLSGKVFWNDPDVLIVRDYNIKFSLAEQKVLAEFLKVTGNVFLTSDDIGRYTPERKALFEEFIRPSDKKLTAITRQGNVLTLDYRMDGKARKLTFDIKNGKRK